MYGFGKEYCAEWWGSTTRQVYCVFSSIGLIIIKVIKWFNLFILQFYSLIYFDNKNFVFTGFYHVNCHYSLINHLDKLLQMVIQRNILGRLLFIGLIKFMTGFGCYNSIFTWKCKAIIMSIFFYVRSWFPGFQ